MANAPDSKHYAHDQSGFKLFLSNTRRKQAQQTTANRFTKFMDFPPEIRNIAYEFVLVKDRTIYIRGHNRGFGGHLYLNIMDPRDYVQAWREPGLLRTSKTIRQEALALYYGSNDFDVTTKLCELEHAVSWVRSIVRQCGNKPFRHFNFYFRNHPWKDAGSLTSIVHLFAETNIKLKPRPIPANQLPVMGPTIQKPDSIFHCHTWFQRPMRLAMEVAVALGKQARRKGWSSERLAEEALKWASDLRDNARSRTTFILVKEKSDLRPAVVKKRRKRAVKKLS